MCFIFLLIGISLGTPRGKQRGPLGGPGGRGAKPPSTFFLPPFPPPQNPRGGWVKNPGIPLAVSGKKGGRGVAPSDGGPAQGLLAALPPAGFPPDLGQWRGVQLQPGRWGWAGATTGDLPGPPARLSSKKRGRGGFPPGYHSPVGPSASGGSMGIPPSPGPGPSGRRAPPHGGASVRGVTHMGVRPIRAREKLGFSFLAKS